VAKRIQIDKSVALKSFPHVIPMQVIEEINAAIDRSFGDTPDRAVSGTMIAEILRRGDTFRQLEEAICARSRPMALEAADGELPLEPFHVIRCASKISQAESHNRHYDSHLLTLLIPLRLASDGVYNGDLVMYRRPRLSVTTLSNVICKIRHGIEQSLPFSCRRWLTMHDLRRGNCARIPVEVGTVYEFNGFALQHANLDVEAGQRRTLLIHYYDPGHSLGLSAIRRRGRIRESVTTGA
jgi:hypothetical protein